MTLQYSILVTLEEDAALADLPSRLTTALSNAAKLVEGVTSVSVDQITSGDQLNPATEP